MIQTDIQAAVDWVTGNGKFQCPSGHFLIQTERWTLSTDEQQLVSMPVRAFLDSDLIRCGRTHRPQTVSMPVRAFLDSDHRLPLPRLGRQRRTVSMPVRAFLDSD